MGKETKKFVNWKQAALAILAIACVSLSVSRAEAQDQDQDDPPSRVARLGFMEGSISFQPAGESDWVAAAPNRPMTTGDKIWVDRDSRAEVQLGFATLNLAANTGFSFLNLDDRTIQIQLSSGILNVRVWDLDRDNVFEIDTPNQAFTIHRRGSYRLDVSEDGNYTVISIREGAGESTGNGQSYNLHEGQRTTFSGTTSLNADVEQIGESDEFDRWAERRERRHEESPSAQYCSPQMVGYQDLDDNGDWRPTDEYGAVWFPHVEAGWAPYHYGHWAWIDPWGWTWVDDARWGYAPFHYGRWVNVYGRWGWIPGPREERPVYAPALVVFVGGSPAGGNVAWFPLGPREVFVPSYHVSEGYVNRVNVSNTTVNTTQVTNVYNTTIINNNTTVNNTNINNTNINNVHVNNITYANRNVQGAVTAMPQQAFATAQPVAKSAVPIDNHQLAIAPVVNRVAVAPAPQAVMGAHVNTAVHVAAPPAAIASRPVIAKTAPPPPPVPFAARQQMLAQHPGQAIAPRQMQELRPANAPAPVLVKQAPPAKPAMPNASATNQPKPQPAPTNNGPAWNNRPDNRPDRTPPPGHMDRPAAEQPESHPQPNQPATANYRPDMNRPEQPHNEHQLAQPESHPLPNAAPSNNHPEPNRAEAPHNDHQSAQPDYRPAGPPAAAQPQPNPPASAQPHPAPAAQQHPQTKPDDKKHSDQK